MPKSIRAWFLFAFLLTALVVGFLFLMTFARLAALRRSTLSNHTNEAAKAASEAAHLFLSGALHTEEDVSRTLAFSGLPSDERQSYLSHLLAHHPEFRDLYYLNGDSVIHAGPSPQTAAILKGHAAVKSVLAGRAWSLASGLDANGTMAPELALMAANDSDAHKGLILGVLSVPGLSAALSQAARGGAQIYLFDRTSRIVCSDKLPLSDAANSLSQEPGLVRALSGHEGSAGSLQAGNRKGQWIGAFVPVQYFGWAAAATDNAGLWMNPLYNEELLTWALYFLVVLAGLVAIHWRTGSLIQSIRRMQRAAQAMAGGDIGYRVKVTTDTEMDTLAGAFNDMAERLEAHQDLLHERNQQLNVLLRLLEGVRTEREPAELFRRITQDAAHVTAAGVAFLALVVDDELQLTEWWNGQRWTKTDLRWGQGEGAPGWVWLKHDTRSSENYASDLYATEEMKLALDLKNYVCAPIVLPNATVAGVLFVGNKAHKLAFKEDDVRIMEILARHAGVAIEVEAAFLRERRIGATLQKAMLPDVDPHLGGLSIAREYRAAADEAELGGDFYDVIELSPDRIGLVIADVSGKGLRAAVQTAAVKYALRAYAMEDPEPASVLRRLNRCCNVGPRTRGFITLFYGVIDLRRWEMTYANAGHQPPLLRRANGKVETLSSRGVVLGVADNNMVSFPSQTVMLGAGDTLVLYTDGLSEARNGDDFLDTEGVQALLGEMDVSAHETARLLLEEATAFAEGALRDDVALLVVKTPVPLPISAEGAAIISYRQ